MTDSKLEILLVAKDKADQAFNSVTNRITAMTKQVLSLNGALAGVAAVTSFGYVAKRAIDATAEIERNAEMAGVGVKAYQELTYASEQYDISQEALADGLKELNLRADEFVATAGGSAAEAFRRLGYSQLELNDRLRDAPALLEDIIRRMEGLDRAAQIRIADELFGGQGGEQFVRMIRAGADELSNLRRRAHELGVVLDADIIRESVEAKKQIDTLNRVLQINFQRTMVSLAPLIGDVATGVSAWVRNNQELLNQDLAAWAREAASGVKSFVDVMVEVSDPGSKIRSDWEEFWDWTEARIKKLRHPFKTISQDIKDFHKIASGEGTIYTPSQVVPGEMTEHERRRLGLSRAPYEQWLSSIGASDNTKAISPLPLIPEMPSVSPISPGYGSAADWLAVNAPGDAADQAYREIEEMLKRRNEMFQKSNRELTELTQRTASEMQGAMSDFFFDAITRELKSTEDYMRAFLQSLARMASEAISQILLQKALGEAAGASSGSGYGWVGSLANLAVNLATRDSGGPVSAGGMYEIGVPEILHTGGKQYLMMGGNQGGYVEPLKDGAQGGQQNIRIINALDPSIVEEWANSPSGERVIMNIIRRNQ